MQNLERFGWKKLNFNSKVNVNGKCLVFNMYVTYLCIYTIYYTCYIYMYICTYREYSNTKSPGDLLVSAYLSAETIISLYKT